MQSEWRPHSIRLLLLVLLQVLVLRQIIPGEGWLQHGEVILYPLFIMMLPLRWHLAFIVMSSFFCGLVIDLFYDTPGVHAATSTLTAFLRPIILQIIAPRSGYDPKQPLTRSAFGPRWFASYAVIFLFVHILMLQIFKVFTFYYFFEILWKTLLTWILSLGVLLLQDLIFNPKR